MSDQADRDELIAKLAANDSDSSKPNLDPTVAGFKADLETFEEQIRQPKPTDPFTLEPECQQAVERIAQLGRDFSPETRAAPAKAPSALNAAPIGTLGQYHLIAKLGEGGMGAVYMAIHSKLERTVAIKVLPANRLTDEQAIARFQREMRAVGKLQHPNIVAAHDAGEIAGTHYLVMELVEGIDLAKLVNQLGTLPISSACELIRQAALGLQHAYEHNLVHRDIKPSNLMLALPVNSRAAPTVKILDLGLALLDGNQIDSKELTSTGQVMGTIDYMSPEQAMDTHTVDIRADIYSLGATLFKLLTGTTPLFDPKQNTTLSRLMALATKAPTPLESLRPDCPIELAHLVSRMLAKSSEDRPATPEELATLLEPFANGADLGELLESLGPLQTPIVEAEQSLVGTLLTADVPTFLTTSPISVHPHLATTPPKPPRKRWTILMATGAAAFMMLAALIIVVTNRGSIEIEGPEELAKEIRVNVLRDGEELKSNWQLLPGKNNVMTVRSGDIEVTLPPGQNEYEIVEKEKLRVTRGKSVVFHLRRILPQTDRDLDTHVKDQQITIDNPRVTAPFTPKEKSDTNIEAGPPTSIIEPPPLEEWLKGREILTVAQDGSGQFTSIQAALSKLQSGQVVKVLDKGPYHERLVLTSSSPDLGLISEVQTQIDFAEPAPEYPNSPIPIGHNFEHFDGLRIHGFRFVMPTIPDGRRLLGMKFYDFRRLVLEDCCVRSEQSDNCSLSFMLTKFGAETPNVFRDCVFEPTVSVYPIIRTPDAAGSALVLRNYFCSKGTGFSAGGRFTFFAARHNIFSSSVTAGFGLDVFHADWFDFSNNTLFSKIEPVLFNALSAEQWRMDCQKKTDLEADRKVVVGHAPTGHGAIVNNLHQQTGFLRVIGGAEHDLWSWDIGYNVYPGDGQTPAEAAMPRVTNTIAAPAFLNTQPESAEYARLKPNSPGAASGAGGNWPTYAGALPPGPAPKEGDWFTRLRERWFDETPNKVAPPIPLTEPPPL